MCMDEKDSENFSLENSEKEIKNQTINENLENSDNELETSDLSIFDTEKIPIKNFRGAQKPNPSQDFNEVFDNKKKLSMEVEEAREIDHMKKTEAALFIAGRWLSMQELILLTDLNPILLRQILDKLIEKYAKDDGKAIEILKKENSWKMDVKSEYIGMINKLATGAAEFTKAEQETLALIAYKQPLKQSVVVKIRGNKCYDHIAKFTGLGLIKTKKQGHTKEISLSDEFYNYFHASGLTDEIQIKPHNS